MNISEMSWKINLKKESSSSTESIDNFTLKANKKSDKLLVQLVFCFFFLFWRASGSQLLLPPVSAAPYSGSSLCRRTGRGRTAWNRGPRGPLLQEQILIIFLTTDSRQWQEFSELGAGSDPFPCFSASAIWIIATGLFLSNSAIVGKRSLPIYVCWVISKETVHYQMFRFFASLFGWEVVRGESTLGGGDGS